VQVGFGFALSAQREEREHRVLDVGFDTVGKLLDRDSLVTERAPVVKVDSAAAGGSISPHLALLDLAVGAGAVLVLLDADGARSRRLDVHDRRLDVYLGRRTFTTGAGRPGVAPTSDSWSLQGFR
jgi:hypothetical protein